MMLGAFVGIKLHFVDQVRLMKGSFSRSVQVHLFSTRGTRIIEYHLGFASADAMDNNARWTIRFVDLSMGAEL
jgi:hypothetical protein